MSHNLSGKRVACLIANGFAQEQMVAMQKMFMGCGANVRTVSCENGLVNGWDKDGWGHHFAVDVPLSKALSADYDMLIIPGGHRSIDKLGLTEHTRRLVSGFVNMAKPVVCMNEAVRSVMASVDCTERRFSGRGMLADDIRNSGATCSEDMMCIDSNIMSCQFDTETLTECMTKICEGLACFYDSADTRQAA